MTPSIESILAPLSLQQFFEDYWEQSPLHIDGRPAEYYTEYLTLSDLEQLLSTQALRFPELQLANSPEPVAPEKYCDADNNVQTDRLLELYHDGATIVLSGAHQLIPSLAQLCRKVLCKLKMPCQTNLYLTPADSQGFNIHYDSHDVFVLQVKGKKQFRFYKGGLSLPFSDQAFDPQLDKAGEEQSSVELLPGDTLYIPRGMMHAAQALGNEPSLHITLGVYATSWRDLLQTAIQCAAESSTALRKSVPLNFAGCLPDSLKKEPAKILSEAYKLLDAQLSDSHLIKALSRLQDDIALSGNPACSSGSLESADSIEGVEFNTGLIAIDHSNILSSDSTENGVSIRLPGRILELNGSDAELWNQLQSQRSIDLSTLSGNPSIEKGAEADRIEFLRNLLDLGLIQMIRP